MEKLPIELKYKMLLRYLKALNIGIEIMVSKDHITMWINDNSTKINLYFDNSNPHYIGYKYKEYYFTNKKKLDLFYDYLNLLKVEFYIPYITHSDISYLMFKNIEDDNSIIFNENVFSKQSLFKIN